jgi:hypothetical protein
MANQKQAFELLPDESVVKEIKGDCWNSPEMLLGGRQTPGKYIFTNQRIIFRGRGLFPLNFELFYKDIVTIKPCIIGFFPFGIKIKVEGNKSYKFSVMKRNTIIELIESYAKL